MLHIQEIRKRIITFIVILVLTISQSGYLSLVEVYGATSDPVHTKVVSVLAFTSDVHCKRKNVSARRLGTWIDKTKRKYGRIDAMGFCGDMASAMSKKNYWKYTGKVMKTAERKVDTVLYTTGNHEYSHRSKAGAYKPGLNKYTKKFIEDAQGVEKDHFRIYCMGSSSYKRTKKMNRYSVDQIEKLKAYLSEIGNEKPIIIITHYPLHSFGKRTVRNSSLLIDTLNRAAVGDPNDTSDDKKIVFLWGHNHSLFDVYYDQIFEPGDNITFSEGNSKTISFFYCAAGCMSDKEYSNGSANVSGKGLVITIDSRHLLEFTYYDEKGFNITEEGTYKESDHSSNISENTTGENTTGENTTGENTTGENTTGENTTGENTTGENTTGNTTENATGNTSDTKWEPKQGVLLPCINAKRGTKLNITWNKVRGAEGYDIYLGEGKDQLQLVQSLSDSQWTASGLKRKTLYQAVVKAYIMQDNVKTYIRTSPVVYAYTSGGTKKLTNPECVTIKKVKTVIKTGKSYKIKANVRKLKKHRKLIGKDCAPKLRYISTDTSVAEVSRSGRIIAKNSGSCMIYVYAVNGARKGITVIVR